MAAQQPDEPGALFLSFSGERLQLLASRITDCLGRLSDQQIWYRASDAENSVANLVLHLSGNVRQWIIAGLADQPDIRQRDEEFTRREGLGAPELCALLDQTVGEALTIIRRIPTARLTETISVQGRNPSVLEAIYIVVEHFGEHTGQIIYITKQMTREDLGYSRHLSSRAQKP